MAGLSAAVRSLLSACLLLTTLSAPLLLSGCEDDPAGPELSADDLYRLVVTSQDLQVLEDVVEELDLASTLATGDLTFFAPTDAALTGLGSDMLRSLRFTPNRDVMRKLLLRHLVPGRFRLADLTDGMVLEPLEGPPLEVRVEGEAVTVGGALITEPDLETENGVLHQVGDIVRDHLTLAERLRVTPLISTFAEALDAAGLEGLAASGEPTTLLIPINSAFDALGSDGRRSLLSADNRNVLEHVLRHHILPGRLRIDELEDGDTLTPLDGSDLPVRVEAGLIFLGGARVIIPEIETSDGLIYLLDTVDLKYLDLAERLQVVPDLTTLQTILSDAGLTDMLGSGGPFTVFAPTDAAFLPLGTPFVPALRARPDLLLHTARYYVVPGRVEPEELLELDALTTLSGDNLQVQVQTVSSTGGTNVFVGGRGLVSFPPVEADNGLIYPISPFLIPPDLNLEERAVFAALYGFLDEMQNAGLTSLLHDEGPYTIFAPTDAALEEANIPASRRRRTLEYHIVEGWYGYEEFGAYVRTLPSLAGPTDSLRVYNLLMAGIWVVGPTDSLKVAQLDLSATNGVIHTLDGVLTPPTP